MEQEELNRYFALCERYSFPKEYIHAAGSTYERMLRSGMPREDAIVELKAMYSLSVDEMNLEHERWNIASQVGYTPEEKEAVKELHTAHAEGRISAEGIMIPKVGEIKGISPDKLGSVKEIGAGMLLVVVGIFVALYALIRGVR